MKKFGVPALLVSGVATALLGLSAPASAGVDHHLWVHQMHQKATVPQVDTTVKHTNVNRTKAMSNR